MSAKYSFSLPARVEFRAGAARDLAGLLQGVSPGKRVFLVTDPGLLQAGLAEPIADALRKNSYTIRIFDQVKPNPRDVDCEAGGDQIRDFGADVVLALGGGSAMDAAKAIGCFIPTRAGSRYMKDAASCKRTRRR